MVSSTPVIVFGLLAALLGGPVLGQSSVPDVTQLTADLATPPVDPNDVKGAISSEMEGTATISSTTTTSTTTTTTTPSTTTSTAAPNTTTSTTTTTTTTAAPPTPLDPTPGHWSASDESNGHICILLQMGIQMTIPYQTTTNQTKTAHVNVPVNATAEGGCGPREYITLSWPSEDATSQLTIAFEDNRTAEVYSVSEMTASVAVTDELFPDHAADQSMFAMRVNFSEVISAPQNASYRCISRTTYQLLSTGQEADDFSGELLLLHSQIQAYKADNSTKFATPMVCSADHRASADIVPIAVGIALALLVVIILIAYIIGRRRRQRGYQSV